MLNHFKFRSTTSIETNPIVKILRFFGVTSHWTCGQLNSYQWQTLEALLKHAKKSSKYYADILPEDIKTLEQFHAMVPVLKRRELQAHIREIICPILPDSMKATKSIFSTGSTGTPVEVVLSNYSEAWFNACHLRDIAWSRWDMEKHLASIKYFRVSSQELSRGQEFPRWDQWIDHLCFTGKASTMAIETDPSIQYRWLKTTAPQYLITYPSNLEALLDEMDRHGEIALESIKILSEPLSAQLRLRAEQVCPVFNTYSSQELGYIASQCHLGNLHIHSEVNYVEILRDDGTSCALGEIGNVVVTNLVNYASPLIRYALGDRASFASPCLCGLPHPVLQNIEGKVHPLFTLPNGERKNSMDLAVIMRKIGGVKQFQIIQDHNGITLNFVPSEDWQEDLKKVISQQINLFFEADMPLSFNLVERIPLLGGKQRHLITTLPQ